MPMDAQTIDSLKIGVSSSIYQNRKRFINIGRKLHEHPETAMHEHQAVQWLTDELKADGFSIEKPICDMPTAFRASYGNGNPHIAILAEYDALPELGHACGHNLIATAAIAAGIAAQKAIDIFGGTVMVIGTPAEELNGGKIAMARNGAFNDIDAAMMVHPAAYDTATIQALACIALHIEFFGKESHAAAYPENGINALEAMIQSFNAINSLRQHIPNHARIHGIITDGGRAANIVPGHSAGNFLIRAADLSYHEVLREKVLNCFKGAAMATGTRLKYRWDEDAIFAPMLNNLTLAKLYITNMARLGKNVPLAKPEQSFGSTDMGNISQIVPAMHAECGIAPNNMHVGEHTPEFAALAYDETSFDNILAAAAGLAMTIIDLIAAPINMAAVQQEFNLR
jgi:amidohydrolase